MTSPEPLTVGVLAAAAAIVTVHGPVWSRERIAAALLAEVDRLVEAGDETEDDNQTQPEEKP